MIFYEDVVMGMRFSLLVGGKSFYLLIYFID